MSITRKIAATATLAALCAATAATAAETPVVSAQRTASSATAPVTIPGTGVKKGERLPTGTRIVYRDVTLDRRQSVLFTMRAPKGKRLRGLAVREPSSIGFKVEQRPDYAGRRQVRVRATYRARETGQVTDRIYALAG